MQMPVRGSDPERLVSASPVDDDNSFELKLSPNAAGEFIGQAKAKEQLAIALRPRNRAAKRWTRAALRPAGSGQDHARDHHRQ